MNNSLRFSIESSLTPIYQRTTNNLVIRLRARGHHVIVEEPTLQHTLKTYVSKLSENGIDYCIITNPLNHASRYSKQHDVFWFEATQCNLIFLHYENCLARHDFDAPFLAKLFMAFQHTSSRSHHFCIESSNCSDLRELGLANVHKISHASEFNYRPLLHETKPRATFIGHLVDISNDIEIVSPDHRIKRDYWSRICDLSYRIEPSANEAYDRCPSTEVAEKLAAKGAYLNQIHSLTPFARSEVLKRAGKNPITIIGGDPGYLNGIDLSRRISKDNFTYQPPTDYAQETATIYNTSLININITALQFDASIINRVIDIGAAGGFALTDWKEDLPGLTSVHEEISFRSPEELNHKIQYYGHPDNQRERLEICDTLHHEIRSRFTYEQIVDYLLSKLTTVGQTDKPLKVDLGCGSHKAHGYIGVDRLISNSVDIQADLSKRFPFATSSVDEIRAHDIIEHLPDRLHTMNEIWRICKPDAYVDIRVPSSDGRGAFQDPTHVSYWNTNSFYYYCRQFSDYLTLCKSYGFKGEFDLLDIKEEASPDRVIHVNVKLRAIKEHLGNSSNPKLLPMGARNLEPEIWEFEEELRQINLLAELDCNGELFKPDSYARLKNLVLGIIRHPRSKNTTLLLQSKLLSTEDISAILMQLMFELISNGQVIESQDLPNLLPAPKNLLTLEQLRPRLSGVLTLSDINSEKLRAALDRA